MKSRPFLILGSVLLLVSCFNNTTSVRSVLSEEPNAISFNFTAINSDRSSMDLTGTLIKPDGKGPFPAVVLLHGCGGIQRKRDHRWAQMLCVWGYVTLQVDSFSPRGISNACVYLRNALDDILRKRVVDAYDAKRYLSTLPFVDKNRIAVMGWSQGGSTTLETLYIKKEEPFRAAVAFYPGCRRPLADMNAPVLILIGEADDWASASRCVARMPKEKTSSDIMLKIYPGAFHGFDIAGAYNNVRGSSGMHHIEYQAEADADSIVQVKVFLKKYLYP